MIFENICTKKEYEVNGVKKVTWLQCGTLRILDNGKKFIELNHMPDITFFVFPKKDKTAPAEQPAQAQEETWLQEDNQ